MTTLCTILMFCALAANNAHAAYESTPEEVTTYREFGVLREQVLRDQLWDTYLRSSVAGEGCDRRMTAIVDGAVGLYLETADRPNPAQFLALVGSVARNCDNVVLKIARGLALDDLKSNDEALSFYRQAIDDAAAGVYIHPAVHARIAAKYGQWFTLWNEEEERQRALAELAIEKLIEASQLVPDDPIHHRQFIEHIRENFLWRPLADVGSQLVEAMAAQKSFDEYTILTVGGIIEIAKAWRARGGGAAQSVTASGWEGFYNHLDNASTKLQLAYELDSTRPEAAQNMILVAALEAGGDRNAARVWFDRALAAQDDWYRAYQTYLFLLQPRWGGSYREMIAFAQECLAKNRFDTTIPLVAVAIARYSVRDANGRHELIRELNMFPLIRTALEGMIASPEHDREREHYRALLFVSAWAAREYELAASMLDSLATTRGALHAWELFEAHHQSTIADVRLFASEYAQRIREADAMVRLKDLGKAIELYATLIEEIEDQHVQQLLRDRMVVAQQTLQFEAGEWVPLMVDEHLTGWEQVSPHWTATGTHLQMQHRYKRPMLISKLPVGHNWEFTIQFSMPERSWPRTDAAIFFNYARDLRSPHARFVSLRHNQSDVQVGFVSLAVWADTFAIDAEGEQDFHMHVFVWGKDVAVKVNGELVFAGQPDMYYQPGGRMGLGGVYHWPAGPIELVTPRIRKLAEKPDILRAQE